MGLDYDKQDIRFGRRVGNTTRQINQEIDELFTKGSALIYDHAHRFGNMAQESHLRVLFRRLYNEFGLQEGKDYRYDLKTKTITAHHE